MINEGVPPQDLKYQQESQVPQGEQVSIVDQGNKVSVFHPNMTNG